MSDAAGRAGHSSGKSCCDLIVFVRADAPNEQTYFLAVSSSIRGNDAVLIKVVATTGELHFTNTPEVDVFPSLDAAKKYLSSKGRISIKKSGCALLGYAIVACNAWVLLATETAPTAYLPAKPGAAGHYVHTVNECSWQVIPLQIRTSYPEQDLKRGEMLNEFAVAGYHYYCESCDLTRPYPSTRPVTEPCWEFVWNYYLTQPFRRVGLPDVAPHMLQGMAEMKSLADLGRTAFTLLLFARRSRLHAGTRYKARGLNNIAGPANEIECEQIVFTAHPDVQVDVGGGSTAKAVKWSSYVWRRGSVPLRWSQTVKSNAVGTAIAIEPERTFSGSRKYFRRLQMRYHKLSLPAAERSSPQLTAQQRRNSLRYPLAVVNLLRKGSMDRDRSEARLYSAFCDLLTALNKQSGINVINIGFDWHELASTHAGLQPVVQMLWAASEVHFRGFAFTQGFLCSMDTIEAARAGDPSLYKDVEECPGGLAAVFEQRQQGVFRFNCADSLDRTNVASFYSSLQVLLEQGRSMKLQFVRHISLADALAPSAPPAEAAQGRAAGSIKKSLASLARGVNAAFGNTTPDLAIKSSSNGNLAAMATYKPPVSALKQDEVLPPGWEKRTWESGDTMRTIYINHIDKSSSWTPPEWPEYKTWELVSQSITDMRRTIHLPLLLEYKNLFLVSGDRNAELYTGSPAMHSAQLDLLLGTGDAGHGITGFINNAHTAVRRRINNIVTDERTHSIFEMVLGLPAKASAGLSTETFNQGISYELSAEAQRLPIADDSDSDDDDVINRMPWPAPAPHSTPSLSDFDASPAPAASPSRPASTPLPATAASPVPGAADLSPDRPDPQDLFKPAYAAPLPSPSSQRRAFSAANGLSGAGDCGALRILPKPSMAAELAAAVPDLLSFSPMHAEGLGGGGIADDPFLSGDGDCCSAPYGSNGLGTQDAPARDHADAGGVPAHQDSLLDLEDPLGALTVTQVNTE